MIAPSRATFELSRAEFERRWALARAAMLEHDLDALVVQGAANGVGIGGAYRWFTGISASGSYPQTIVFPRVGTMTLICHGGFNETTLLSDEDPLLPGIGKRRTTSMFPSVSYTATYDAEIVADEIAAAGYRRIGTLAPGTTYYGFGATLRERLPHVEIEDASDVLDVLRAVKSDEEILAIRRTASLQDDVLRAVCDYARPGMHDFEVMAYAQYVGAQQGSETGYFLGSSASAGEAAMIRARSQQGRRIGTGDTLYFQTETTGPGGYFVHLGRFLVFGRAEPAFRAAFSRAIEAQDYTVQMLGEETNAAHIYERYAAYLANEGHPPETRLHAHGQGYDVVERPLIRQDETMPIGPRLNIGIHPSFGSRTSFVTVCDNFLTHDHHVERLHQSPREIIEL